MNPKIIKKYLNKNTVKPASTALAVLAKAKLKGK